MDKRKGGKMANMNYYKRYITPDYEEVILPNLKGTEKQIKWASAIRDKYTDIYIRKLAEFKPSDKESRMALTKKFIAYIECDKMLNAYEWIENHCSNCGCYLVKDGPYSYCSNTQYCSYKKENNEFTVN